MDTYSKYEKLLNDLSQMPAVLLAYSGGVDSTFLLHCCLQVLSPNAIFPVIIKSPFIPDDELKNALQLSQEMGANLKVLEIDILDNTAVVDNSNKRCYFCKLEILSKLKQEGAKFNIRHYLEGSNADDLLDYRPGSIAVKEMNFISPLQNANLTKQEIRNLSKKFKLPTWQKPSMACLASRIPYGEKITATKLQQVEKAEKILAQFKISNLRVRHHNAIARIEIPENEFSIFLDEKIRKNIVFEIKQLGFKYVALDLLGYRQGSLNEVL